MKASSDTDLRASLSLSLGAACFIDRQIETDGTSRAFVAREESENRDVAIIVLAEELTIGVDPDGFLTELRQGEHSRRSGIQGLPAKPPA